ncbi:hypothetical protein C2E23DRAFT_278502 [Lenzites betulinus]|nr:hypothetical protein C2E23DRAFT_278502 [Lenzites betulinus]
MRPNIDVMLLARQLSGSGDTDHAEPTPLPLSADMESSRPEIGGSFGGFLVVVVVLAVIFLVSSIGIFILLRNHEPTPHERSHCRARARARDFSSEVPIGPPGIRERLARLFGKQTGWVKASDTEAADEWDASDDRIPNPFDSLRERDRLAGEYPASFASPSRPRAEEVARSFSTDSVEVELNAPSAAYGGPSRSPAPSFLQYSDDGSSSIHGAPMSNSVSPPLPSLLHAPDREVDPGARDERHFSVPVGSVRTGSELGSVRSMRKFDNGTKFKESL